MTVVWVIMGWSLYWYALGDQVIVILMLFCVQYIYVQSLKMMGWVNLSRPHTVLPFDLVAIILLLWCMLVEIFHWLISFRCVLFSYPKLMLLDSELLIVAGSGTQ